MVLDEGQTGSTAHHPDRLMLMPSIRKTAAFSLGTASFSVVGALLIALGGSIAPLGWIFVVLFGSLTGMGLLAWRAFRSGRVFLELTGGWFAVHTIKGTAACPWADVKLFAAESVGIPIIGLASWQSRVYFDLLPSSPGLGRPWSVWAQGSGHDGLLPDNYGLRAQALSTLMNEWRLRAIGKGTLTPVPSPSSR